VAIASNPFEMAGKRQHFLPRLLTSGFASCQTTKEIYTCLFEQSGEPRQENIVNVAVEGYFYGRESTTDLELTRLEGTSFGPLVHSIRATSAILSSSTDEVADFVASLVTRSPNLRELIGDAATAMGSALSQYSDPERLKRALMRYVDDHPDEILGLFLQPYGITRVSSIPMNKRLYVLNRVREFLAAELPDLTLQASVAAGHVREHVMTEPAVRKWHLDALQEDVTGTARGAPLKSFTWAVSRVGTGALILGDVGPIRYLLREQRYEALIEPEDCPQVVILPISHGLLLRGSNVDLPAFNKIDEINAASSALTYEFFISSTNTAREHAYREHLGRETHAIWKNAALS